MKKTIQEMTKEEIAQAFPVKLSDYQEIWPALFEAEKQRLQSALGAYLLRLEHFGSTSIMGMTAKDTIDMMADIHPAEAEQESIVAIMKENGYDFLWQPDGNPPYRVFVKGFGAEEPGQQEFIIHSASQDHHLWDRLFFRDYLRAFPKVAEDYIVLKQQLAIQFQYDRVGYRIAKTDFVMVITEKAKAYFQG